MSELNFSEPSCLAANSASQGAAGSRAYTVVLYHRVMTVMEVQAPDARAARKTAAELYEEPGRVLTENQSMGATWGIHRAFRTR